MIYAIYRETKEHRIYRHPNDAGFWEDCELVQADADGWIPWSGGECPLPDGVSVEVLRLDGVIIHRDCPSTLNWSGVRDQYAIRAYRPILDAEPSEPEAPEWPQPGDTAELHNDEGYHIEYGDHLIGEEVEVLSLFHDGIVLMAAVGREGKCYCFRADMLRPLRTPAQLAEDDAIKEILEVLRSSNNAKEAASALYLAGYRKEAT